MQNMLTNSLGGALFLQNTSFLIENTNFSNNSAKYGGSLAIINTIGNSYIRNSNFELSNAFSDNGGGLFLTTNLQNN